jgi:hypothetical protein
LKDNAMHNPEIQAYLSAAASLMNRALAEAQQDEPEAAVGLANILRAGGIMKLSSIFSHCTKQANISCELVAPGGESFTLLSCDIEPEHTA